MENKFTVIAMIMVCMIGMTGIAMAGSNNMYYNGDGSYTANFDATGSGEYRITTYTTSGHDYQYGAFDGSVSAWQSMNAWQNGGTYGTQITRRTIMQGDQYVSTYSEDNSGDYVHTYAGSEDGGLGLFQTTTMKDNPGKDVVRAGTFIIIGGDDYFVGVNAVTGDGNAATSYGAAGSGVAMIGDSVKVKTHNSGKETSRQNTWTLAFGPGAVYGSVCSPGSIEFVQSGYNDGAHFTDQHMYGESGLGGFYNQHNDFYWATGYVYAADLP